MDELDDLDFWRLCDEMTVYQAAHLMMGMSPVEVEAASRRGSELTARSARRYEDQLLAITTAVGQALRKGQIIGENVGENDYDFNGNPDGFLSNTTDPKRSTIDVASLKQWLATRGIKAGFFFPQASGAPDYLDQAHPRYAPKLAAAVRAWLAIEDPKGKHPKQALTKWLRENAADFGLSDEEGKPNEQGIEECAKVANWQPGGGAPKTPGG